MRLLRFRLKALTGLPLLRREEGQVLAVAAALLVTLLAFVAMSIDIGYAAQEKRRLQTMADAAALAGVRALPLDLSTANADALAWAAKNGGTINGRQVESVEFLTTYYPNDTIRVTMSHPDAPLFFGRVLDFFSIDIEARAAARVGSPVVMSGLVPWGVPYDAYSECAPPLGELPEECTLVMKFNAPPPWPGNFGALAIDGRGAHEYEEDVKYGADTPLCSLEQGDLAPEGCQFETETEPGNMINPTRQAVQWRLDNTQDPCNDFDSVFSDNNGDGIYDIRAECNPFQEGIESCDQIQSCRILPVPIIDQFGQGRTQVTVVTFGLFWLEGFAEGDDCRGDECQVVGRFVRANASIAGVLGRLLPDSSIILHGLVE